MPSTLYLLLAALLALLPMARAVAGAAPQTPLSLHWKNGDFLQGEPVNASPTTVTWKSPLFDEPLVLEWSALLGIDGPVQDDSGSGPFGIALRDGSFLFAAVTAVTERTVSIHAARFGDAVLNRSEVLSIRRISGGDLVYGGPAGEAGWTRSARDRDNDLPAGNPAPFKRAGIATGGVIALDRWDSSIGRDFTLPARVKISFRVRSSKRLDFALILAPARHQQLRLETWDSDLVLTCANQFKAIGKQTADEHEAALCLCWDRAAGRCSVYQLDGKWIADWNVPPVASSQRNLKSLVFQNKGRDLSLDFLEIRSWDGKPPTRQAGQPPFVELADGSTVEGSNLSGVPLHDVDTLVFSSQPARSKTGPAAILRFSDGTLLTGVVQSIAGGCAMLQGSFADKPLPVRLDGLCLLLPAASTASGDAEEPGANLDLLSIGDVTLHGKFYSGDDERLRWVAVGGTAPAVLAKSNEIELVRADETVHSGTQAISALIYTTAGDALPCTVTAANCKGVEFQSELVDAHALAADCLDAVHFNVQGRSSFHGFDSPDWQLVKGSPKAVRRDGGTLRLEPGVSLLNPAAMMCDEIRFTMARHSMSGIRLRLFCSGTENAGGLRLVLCTIGGNRVLSGVEKTDGQYERQTQTAVGETNGPLAVRLLVKEQEIQLELDGTVVQKVAIAPGSRSGTGLMIEPTSVWETGPVSLSSFEAVSRSTHAWLPLISEETRRQTLTVPRFRKEAPPCHALVAANGDVLRGQIEGITSTHLVLRTGLEVVRVPRDRLKAVIWLKALEQKSAPRAAAPVPVPTMDMARHALEDLRMLDAAVDQCAIEHNLKTGTKLRFADLAVFLKPGTRVSRNRDPLGNSYGDEFVVDAIPTLGAESWAAFRSVTPVEFWKPFERKGRSQGIIARPMPGAGAMAPALPSHWLCLANGAELGFTVEKFGKTYITGTHPLYGRCRVPLAEVRSIGTSPPSVSESMMALRGWRLVSAPEPVLPVAGGENSPLIGHEAPDFKLSRLNGDAFVLKQEKGKVVVLDFWATWCGPCVQSLPELIQALAAFQVDRVKLLGVNQGEPPDRVTRFLEARGWKLDVALDSAQSVAAQYGVDGIPHTVIVGPDGKVLWVHTGYTPTAAAEAAEAVKKALGAPSTP